MKIPKIVIYIILILISMAVLNWGDLTKNQEDSETIEQSIARIVAEHNSDEEAHVASGQSLEAHKSANIIDHPAGSLVADKQSTIEIQYKSNFDSISSWAKGGEIESIFNACQMYIEKGGTENSYLFGANAMSSGVDQSINDWLFQEVVWFDKTTNKIELAFGVTQTSFSSSSVPASGVYFYYNDGVLYSKINKLGGTEASEVLSAVDLSIAHIFRIHNNIVTGNVDFYIDGVIVSSLQYPAETWTIGFGTFHHLKSLATMETLTECTMLFSNLFFSYNI